MKSNGVPQDIKSLPTLIQIKAAIPTYLFETNLLFSLYYVVKDIALIVGLCASLMVLEWILPASCMCIVLPIYWYLQGTMLMAVFVLGHDCGHGSFSKYETINDVFGTVLHSVVLTPYYPWKISHRNHHKHTGNIDKDEVFYPVRKEHENGNNFAYLFGLGFGWFVYLWRGYHPRNVCHLNPLEPMFSNHVTGCTLSIASLICWVGCLYFYACSFGLWELLKYYFIPEMVFASWLLIVTFLHHIEEKTPWYSGNLSSAIKIYFWNKACFNENLSWFL
jgi:omega-3 fatty acid desaturase (delta-15 desaturase)